MVVVVVGEGDDCVFEFVVFVGEQPYFVSEYGVAFGFFPVVADEVVGVLQMGCYFRILVFDPLDFEAFYTYIIYRGRFQDLLHVAGDLCEQSECAVYDVSVHVCYHFMYASSLRMVSAFWSESALMYFLSILMLVWPVIAQMLKTFIPARYISVAPVLRAVWVCMSLYLGT